MRCCQRNIIPLTTNTERTISPITETTTRWNCYWYISEPKRVELTEIQPWNLQTALSLTITIHSRRQIMPPLIINRLSYMFKSICIRLLTFTESGRIISTINNYGISFNILTVSSQHVTATQVRLAAMCSRDRHDARTAYLLSSLERSVTEHGQGEIDQQGDCPDPYRLWVYNPDIPPWAESYIPESKNDGSWLVDPLDGSTRQMEESIWYRVRLHPTL